MNIIKKTTVALCAALTLSGAASAEPLPLDEQFQALAKTAMVYNGWFVLPERDKNVDAWRYAITDLDHNGRLEVMKAKHSWAEGVPSLLVKELNEDGSRLQGEIALSGTAVPDILATSDPSAPILVLHDAKNDLYHYIFQETIYHTEYESVTTKYALTFSKGTLYIVPLACFQWNLSGMDGSVTNRYYLPKQDGDVETEIDVTRYNTIEQEEFPGCEVQSVSLWWRTPEELKEAASLGRLKDALAQSYSSFAR